MRTRIRLDWSQLLGFDQLEPSKRTLEGARLAKVGEDDSKIDRQVRASKIGAKIGTDDDKLER